MLTQRRCRWPIRVLLGLCAAVSLIVLVGCGPKRQRTFEQEGGLLVAEWTGGAAYPALLPWVPNPGALEVCSTPVPPVLSRAIVASKAGLGDEHTIREVARAYGVQIAIPQRPAFLDMRGRWLPRVRPGDEVALSTTLRNIITTFQQLGEWVIGTYHHDSAMRTIAVLKDKRIEIRLIHIVPALCDVPPDRNEQTPGRAGSPFDEGF